MDVTAQSIRQSFATVFGGTPDVATRAPGRLEILGNHTDYNQGVVLSVAVDRASDSTLKRTACPSRRMT